MDLNIIGDYHTHTRIPKGNIKVVQQLFGKHAKGSVLENANVAISRNLREIAITDHGYKHLLYGMEKKAYKEVRESIDELNLQFSNNKQDIKVFLGVEANIMTMNGDIDVDDDILQYLDIICAGFHRGVFFGAERVRKNFTEAAINAMLKYDIAILNHPCDKTVVDILQVGKIAIERNTAIELNRKHGNIAFEDIKRLKALGATFSLGSDSHKSQTIGDFGEAYKVAIEAGLTKDDIVNADGKAHKKLKLLRNL
jgi:putative hydrolase